MEKIENLDDQIPPQKLKGRGSGFFKQKQENTDGIPVTEILLGKSMS